MYLQKVISRKNFVKNLFFAGILKVNDEKSRIRIRIRIHPKMSWIRNTDRNVSSIKGKKLNKIPKHQIDVQNLIIPVVLKLICLLHLERHHIVCSLFSSLHFII
jgi:hypothetical protein